MMLGTWRAWGEGAAEGVWSGNPPYTRLLWAHSSAVFFLWLACCSVSGGFAWEFLSCSTKDQSLQSKQRPSSLERLSALPSSYTYKTVALKKKNTLKQPSNQNTVRWVPHLKSCISCQPRRDRRSKLKNVGSALWCLLCLTGKQLGGHPEHLFLHVKSWRWKIALPDSVCLLQPILPAPASLLSNNLPEVAVMLCGAARQALALIPAGCGSLTRGSSPHANSTF